MRELFSIFIALLGRVSLASGYDSRFDRDNIEKLYIKDADHFGWLEKPDVYKEAFNSFLEQESSTYPPD
ncbi:MAG: hypothetical protein K0U13_03060 [Chlamydiae bacterium]|nr:hypothetical protein [Chlamydiales bacterium]MCH9703748.1 hypothetical protein [Chlamydiota bacterium]